ncbi:hypothetical protein ABID23_001564 [Bartonella silvatica]|uniref:Uncharacterized protein n=1 Tax=Bartonella silvatica TaxID=357760 RepID=A0ABV2HIR7_9HYPH
MTVPLYSPGVAPYYFSNKTVFKAGFGEFIEESIRRQFILHESKSLQVCVSSAPKVKWFAVLIRFAPVFTDPFAFW